MAYPMNWFLGSMWRGRHGLDHDAGGMPVRGRAHSAAHFQNGEPKGAVRNISAPTKIGAATIGRLAIVSDQSRDGKALNYFRGNEATSVRIWSLCEGRDGRLWIGTSGRGLFCFDDNRFPAGIPRELAGRMTCGPSAKITKATWLGTSGGGLRNWWPQPVQCRRADGAGLPSSSPTALALDAGAGLWGQRGGLFVGEGGRFERFGGGEWKQICVFDLRGRERTLWGGTLGGGLYGLQRSWVRFTTANGWPTTQYCRSV